MEVRIESMVCLWDDKIPTMFIEFVNLLTLATSEGQLRRSVSTFLTTLKSTIMATRMTINGISTCTEAGTEKYERFQLGIGRRKRTLVQYDYRHPTNGELFSCVKPTLDECRAARDKWLTAKEEKEDRR